MDEPKRKRSGPLTWLAGRSRRFWIVSALVVLIVYLLSLPWISELLWKDGIPPGFVEEAFRCWCWPLNCVLECSPQFMTNIWLSYDRWVHFFLGFHPTWPRP